MNLAILIGLLLGAQAVLAGDEPPQYGYENLPETRFSCEGKLPGRYYADPETDCQMFHVCVKMSKREIHDFRFLCPNGTVFDQEHLVCADFYQVACHSNPQSSSFGHIFEFLKLSASKDATLDYGKVPVNDPEYLGRNTLNDDFQAEEYNNNKLAAQGNALYNSQNLPRKEIKFPTTTTRKAAPTTTTTTFYTPTTTRATTPRPVVTTSAAPAYYTEEQYNYQTSTVAPYAPVDEYNYSNAPNYVFQDNLNFHRETDVPQSFPVTSPTTTTTPPPPPPTRRVTSTTPAPVVVTTTRRPGGSGFFSGNFNRNSFVATINAFTQLHTNPLASVEALKQTPAPVQTTTTYAPPQTTTVPTRRPAVYQSTFRTVYEPESTARPQQTFQQQPSRFNDEYFRKVPGTEQTTTQRIQNLFYNGNSIPTTTASPRTYAPPTTQFPRNYDFSNVANNANYYNVDNGQDLAYLPQGRSVGSESNRNRVQQNNFLSLPHSTSSPELYNSSPGPIITSYQPTNSPGQQNYPVDNTYNAPSENEAFPTETTTTTTTTFRPRGRGGRRRVNPNRQRTGAPKNFDPEFKYSRRVEQSRFDQRDRETYTQRQKSEEIFNAEASIFRGQPQQNNFYNDESRRSNVDQPATSTQPPLKKYSFGGESFGRRIRPGRVRGETDVDTSASSVTPASERQSEDFTRSRPRNEGSRVVKRLRQKTTTEATTTIAYEPVPFSSTYKPTRTNVRTKTIVGPISPDAYPSSDGKRRVIIKKIRPKTTTTFATEATSQPELFASSTERYNDFSSPAESLTTLKIEEIHPVNHAAKPAPAKNYTSTIGGFKVTVISKSSDQQTSTSNVDSESSATTLAQTAPTSRPKAFFPKLNKKLIAGGPATSKQSAVSASAVTASPDSNGEIGSTQSPDYDYSYYNTDDESQYVAEDRLYGQKGRKRASRKEPDASQPQLEA